MLKRKNYAAVASKKASFQTNSGEPNTFRLRDVGIQIRKLTERMIQRSAKSSKKRKLLGAAKQGGKDFEIRPPSIPLQRTKEVIRSRSERVAPSGEQGGGGWKKMV